MDSVTSDLLYKHLRKLKRRQRLAIQLRFWESFSIQEIATVLGSTWDETDRLIETTLCELRHKLTNNDGLDQFAA